MTSCQDRSKADAKLRRSRRRPAARLVLGIDPGLDRTGYAVVDADAGRLIDAGLIRSTVCAPLAMRVAEIDAGIEEVFSEHTVSQMVIEDLFAHYRHPRTAILMGHARGVILLAAARRGVTVSSVSATRIKKTLTGNGHAGKLQMQRAIMAAFGLGGLPEPPDVADALAAAYYAVSSTGGARSHQGVPEASEHS